MLWSVLWVVVNSNTDVFRSIQDSDSDPFRLMSTRLESYEGHSGSVKGIVLLDHLETAFLSHGRDHTVKIWSVANQRSEMSSALSKGLNLPTFTYMMHKKSLNGIFYSSYLNKVVSSDGNIHVSPSTLHFFPCGRCRCLLSRKIYQAH